MHSSKMRTDRSVSRGVGEGGLFSGVDTRPEQNDRHTLLKTLPSLAVGKNIVCFVAIDT